MTSAVASHLLSYQFHRILNLLNKVVLSIWCSPHDDISKSFVFSGNKNNTLSTRCCTSKSFLYMHTYTITHHIHLHVSAHMLSRLRPIRLFVTLWTVAHQAPLSKEFSRQEYWKGLPCPPPGDLLDTGIKPGSPSSPTLQVDFLLLSPMYLHIYIQKYILFMLTNWSLQLPFSRYKPKDDQGFNWFVRDYTASKLLCYQPGFLASLIRGQTRNSGKVLSGSLLQQGEGGQTIVSLAWSLLKASGELVPYTESEGRGMSRGGAGGVA